MTQLSGWLLPALEIKQLLFKKFSHYYCTPFIENKNTVANLVMDATIVNYNSRVVLTTRQIPRVLDKDRRDFTRLATCKK